MVEETAISVICGVGGNCLYFPFHGPPLIMNAYVLHYFFCEIVSSSLCSVNNNACTDP